MPYTSKIASVRNGAVFFLISFFLAGCSFDPTKDVVSAERPADQIADDGTMWTAELRANSTVTWFYVPIDVAKATGGLPAPTGFQLDQVLNDKIYRSTKNADGSYSFNGAVDASISANSGLVMFAGLAGSAAVAMIFQVIAQHVQLEKEKEKVREGHASVAASKKQSDERHTEVEKERDEARRCTATAEKALVTERLVWDGQRIALAAEWEQVEQQKKSMAIVARAINMKPPPPTDKDWQRMSSAVRAEMLRGGGNSDELCVHYVFDPNHSGALLFEYEVLLNCPKAPTVVIYRDNKEISRQSGQFKGKYPTRLLDFTRGHDFVFKVLDGRREYPNPLILEVIAPPIDAWPATPEKEKKQKKQTRAQWIAASVKHLKQSHQWPEDEEKRKVMLAQIEAEAAEIFPEGAD